MEVEQGLKTVAVLPIEEHNLKSKATIVTGNGVYKKQTRSCKIKDG
jgi:hypothetical protein